MQKPSRFAVVSLLMASVLGTASAPAEEEFDANLKRQLPRTDAKAPPQPPTNRAIVHIDTAAPSRTYSRMIFGGFLEHFDNQIYGGVFEPGSPLAEKQGFRTDAIPAPRAMKVFVIRWPGGCFVDS